MTGLGNPWCATCGLYMYNAAHKCPPAWDVWEDGYHKDRSEAQKVYATDATEAAEEYALQSDAYGDYSIIGGAPATVFVVAHDAAAGTEPQAFTVKGEAVPQYYAKERVT